MSQPETICGVKVGKILENGPKAIYFSDEAGGLWRYLRTFRKAWPVEFVKRAGQVEAVPVDRPLSWDDL